MQRFFNSAAGVSFGLTLGRLTPPKLGYRLSAVGAKFLARRADSPMIQAIRSNQAVIRSLDSMSKEIDQAVREVLIHAGRCFVDLYHNLKNPLRLKALSPLTPELENLIQLSHDDTNGAFIVAPHLSNFDLVMSAAAYRGIKAQVLTYGNPTSGYEIQNELRAKTGLNITPVSAEAHQHAIENMRRGGFVITAVDRPIKRKTHYLQFFGQPSPLPAGHIRMAMDAEVPIIVVAAEMKPDGYYCLHISDPIELVRLPDPKEEIRINGEAVLKKIETYIRSTPSQWLMYYPVWQKKGGRNQE
jgi:KDO2-lipid IV(A) lauroyltransferase